jgi:hypothetical protein
MADQPDALRMADSLDKFSNPWDKEVASELRRLHAVNAELLEAMISFTNSAYIKKHHPKRYAAAVAAIAKAEAQP